MLAARPTPPPASPPPLPSLTPQGQFQQREYRDATDAAGGAPTGGVYPTKDADGNKLETDYGMCMFKNWQMVTLQEMPESAPLGQLPRSVDVYCEQDLVDQVKPGDRVAVVGVYRALASTAAASLSGMFRSLLIATHVSRISRESGAMTLSPGDVYRMRLPGGGGWGDPKARDRARLIEDVRNGYVTREAAARDYGVTLADADLAPVERNTGGGS